MITCNFFRISTNPEVISVEPIYAKDDSDTKNSYNPFDEGSKDNLCSVGAKVTVQTTSPKRASSWIIAEDKCKA